jgi:hypothetical protein
VNFTLPTNFQTQIEPAFSTESERCSLDAGSEFEITFSATLTDVKPPLVHGFQLRFIPATKKINPEFIQAPFQKEMEKQ